MSEIPLALPYAIKLQAALEAAEELSLSVEENET